MSGGCGVQGSNDWDGILILRPGLSKAARRRLVRDILVMIERELEKGVDGGGTHFTARLAGMAPGQASVD